MTTVSARPMFPLGMTHLPGDMVALRVFESRYVSMVKDLLAGEQMQFGTVLITAGSEVGGGERRADHGVLIDVGDCVATAEGGYALMGTAVEVFSVVEWLPDDPYPRALVETRRSEVPAVVGASAEDHRRRVTRLAQNIRTLLERAAENAVAGVSRFLPPREVLFALRTIASGADAAVPASVRAHAPVDNGGVAEVESAVWLLARAVPCGPLDRLTLLATAGLGPRIGALEAIVEHVSEILDFGR